MARIDAWQGQPHSQKREEKISPKIFTRLAAGFDEGANSNLTLLRQASLRDNISGKETKIAIEIYLNELLKNLTRKVALYVHEKNNKEAARLSSKLGELEEMTKRFLDKPDKEMLKALVGKFAEALVNPVHN